VGINSVVGFSDESGAFVLESAPSGDVSIHCQPSAEYWTDGKSDLTLSAGQQAICEVPVVQRNPDAPAPGHVMGAELDPSATPVRFTVIAPGGPAARAGLRVGDVVLTIDGASVTRLTPWGVQTLIAQRPAGATAHLGVSRGGQTVAAELIVSGQ
jgi:S1-C subfamily serine protease